MNSNDQPYEWVTKDIIYFNSNYIDKEKYRPNGSLQAEKYYFRDETEQLDGNGPFDTLEECQKKLDAYQKNI